MKVLLSIENFILDNAEVILFFKLKLKDKLWLFEVSSFL